MEFPVSVICSGFEEIKQNLIGIRSTDELSYGKTHELCIECGKDVTEISGGNTYIDKFTVLDPALFKKSGISINIVADLGNKAAYVDGVCG